MTGASHNGVVWNESLTVIYMLADAALNKGMEENDGVVVEFKIVKNEWQAPGLSSPAFFW